MEVWEKLMRMVQVHGPLVAWCWSHGLVDLRTAREGFDKHFEDCWFVVDC